MKLTEIMLVNDVLKKHKRDGAPFKTICETWDHLQVHFAFRSERRKSIRSVGKVIHVK